MSRQDWLTKEQRSKYNKCYAEAREYFNLKEGWVLHHKDETLKYTDIERYIEWRADDLVPMTKSDHMALHNRLRGERPVETKLKISNSMLGNTNGKGSPGQHWYTNGVDNIRTSGDCPEGFWRGRVIK